MIYQLYRAVDRRDNTEALWLLRAQSGAHQMEEMAYLGKDHGLKISAVTCRRLSARLSPSQTFMSSSRCMAGLCTANIRLGI